MFQQLFSSAEKIIKAKCSFQEDQPFFAFIALHVQFIEDSSVKTASINAKGICRFNPAFIEKLAPNTEGYLISFDYVKGLVAHEISHVAFKHFLRQTDRDHHLWNIATDLAINYILVRNGFKLPPGGLIPDYNGYFIYTKRDNTEITINVANKSAEQIYEELYEKPPADNYQSMDQHNYPEDDTKEPPSSIEIEQIEDEWNHRIIEAEMYSANRGVNVGGIKCYLNELLDPKLNWKSILHQYITKDLLYNYTYRKPGKRSYSLNTYMPTTLKENLNIVVTIDISASVTNEIYKEFMSEILGIANAFEQINMTVIHWDVTIRSITKVTRNNKKILMNMAPTGRGRTIMSCLGEHFQKIQTPLFMVHLTDGEIEEKPFLPKCRHLFVLPEKRGYDKIIKKYGIVLKLK